MKHTLHILLLTNITLSTTAYGMDVSTDGPMRMSKKSLNDVFSTLNALQRQGLPQFLQPRRSAMDISPETTPPSRRKDSPYQLAVHRNMIIKSSPLGTPSTTPPTSTKSTPNASPRKQARKSQVESIKHEAFVLGSELESFSLIHSNKIFSNVDVSSDSESESSQRPSCVPFTSSNQGIIKILHAPKLHEEGAGRKCARDNDDDDSFMIKKNAF